MDYIKVIFFLSIELIFATERIHSEHLLLNECCLYDKCLMNARYMDKSDKSRYHLWNYTVYLKMDIELDYIKFAGQVDMDIYVSLPNSSILTLYIQDLNIDFVRMRRTNDWTLIRSSYFVEKFDLKIFFKDSLPPGSYTLRIGFKSDSANISYPSKPGDPNNRPLIIMQPTRQLFPYWKELFNQNSNLYKVTFNISVLHSIGYTVLSNAKVSKNLNYTNSNIWSIFEPISMMPDKLVIILLPTMHNIYTNSEFFELNPLTKIWCRTNTTSTLLFARNVIKKVTLRLFEYTNETYPNLKIDHVVMWDASWNVPSNFGKHKGIITYRESEVIYEEEKDLLDVKFNVMKRITSKVARQWIGGLTTPQISDSWISTSFAKFFELYIASEVLRKWRYESRDDERYEMFLLVQLFNSLLIQDDGKSEWLSSSLPPVFFWDPDDPLLADYYKDAIDEKGALLLRMLQHMIGEKTFRNGVIKFLNKGKYQLVTTDELWSAMQTALNATKSKCDIKKVMDTYVKEQSYPVVIVTYDKKTEETKISQQPYNTFHMLHDVLDTPSFIFPAPKLRSPKWWIPITYATESSPYFNKTIPVEWLRPDLNTIKFKTKQTDWVIVNIKQTGYYRVHYDREIWERIGYFLNHKDFTQIHVLNRAQLIHDICDMFKNGRIDWALFTSITSYLSEEYEYIVWMPMLKCLSQRDMILYFNFPENKQHWVQMANYFNNIIPSVFENIADDDIADLGWSQVAYKACEFGHSRCIHTASNWLYTYLLNSTEYPISQRHKYWAFCYGLKTKSHKKWNIEEIWRQLLQKLTREKESFCPLACIENSTIIINFIDTILENKTIGSIGARVVPNFIYCLFNSPGSISLNNNNVFSYLLKRFVSKRVTYIDDIPGRLIEAVYIEDQLDEISNIIINTYGDKQYFSLYKDKIEKRKKLLSDVRNKFDNVQQTKIF